MDSSKQKLLWAHLRSLQRRLDNINVPPDILRRQISETYLQQLEKLTDSEAVQYLKSVDDSCVADAYLILSKRICSAVLASICLGYMASLGPRTRLTGALGIGMCLKRTADKEASHALACMVCNVNEEAEIRLAAYGSLEVIHWERNPGTPEASEDKAFGPPDPDTHNPSDKLQAIDWSFVNSFR